MTPELTENNFLLDLIELLKRDGSSGFRELAETMYNVALVSERTEALKASPYERTYERQGYANGFKPRKLMTRVGELICWLSIGYNIIRPVFIENMIL